MLVDLATTAYNCMSYAWLSLDDVNEPYRIRVVVNSQAVFLNDKSYRCSTTVRKGSVVTWSNHAGVVKETSYTYTNKYGARVTEPLIISKWGPNGPLVSHPLSQGGFMHLNQMYYK